MAVTYGGGSAGNYAGFDALGRVLRKYQQTDSVNYLVEASYSVGLMTSETYPSVPGAGDRRTITYTPDAAGRLASLNSNATTYAPGASVSSIGYASQNALNTETYGNGLIHAINYNNRLQANEVKLGTSGNPTSVIDLNYNYGTTNNNGNVQSMTYAGGGLSYTQSFTYDSLNRLQTTQENSGSSWSQTNGYDQYGNRWIDYGGGNHNLAFSATTNRITTSGFTYDSAGNLLNDSIHAYTYDAETKISKVDSVTAYVYDGAGQRVRKLVGENTRFVYGIGGELIAEFDGSTGNLKKEYVYGGATLITIEPTAVNSNGTQYSTDDNLGSPRVITNSSAGVVSRHDYLPFGGELGAGVGGRTTAMGFSNSGDNNRKKFTQQERDNETGLDYMHARYYANTQGRFTSPDSLLGSIANPQTLNRYAYVGNNPPNSTDPTGHLPSGTAEWSPLRSGGDGGYSSFDDPNNPDAVLMSMGYLPGRYENASAALIGFGETIRAERDAEVDRHFYEGLDELGGDVTASAEITGVAGAPQNLTSGATGGASDPWNANATMVNIWGPGGVNQIGHVSYITMQDDVSLSWQAEGAPFFNEWTKNTPSSDYTNERSKTSAGVGYILDFGTKINDKFQKNLKSYYEIAGGVNGPYNPICNNCASAFVGAMNSIRKDLGVPMIIKPSPAAIEKYIRTNLMPYVMGIREFPKH